MERLQVTIVEDDTELRESLRLLFSREPGFGCQSTYRSAEEALRRMNSAPDVLLLDIRLPGEPGSRAVRSFLDRFPGLTVVMLTLYADEEHVFEALCNGATGYLLKKTPPARLFDAVREAHDGGSPMSPEIARKVVHLFRRFPADRAADSSALTVQERRFLELASEGHSYKAAADALGVSINTVRNYVRAIYEKLQVHSRSEAVAKALRTGLI